MVLIYLSNLCYAGLLLFLLLKKIIIMVFAMTTTLITGLFCSGESMRDLGRYYAHAIRRAGFEFDVIFGPAYKVPLNWNLLYLFLCFDISIVFAVVCSILFLILFFILFLMFAAFGKLGHAILPGNITFLHFQLNNFCTMCFF